MSTNISFILIWLIDLTSCDNMISHVVPVFCIKDFAILFDILVSLFIFAHLFIRGMLSLCVQGLATNS